MGGIQTLTTDLSCASVFSPHLRSRSVLQPRGRRCIWGRSVDLHITGLRSDSVTMADRDDEPWPIRDAVCSVWGRPVRRSRVKDEILRELVRTWSLIVREPAGAAS